MMYFNQRNKNTSFETDNFLKDNEASASSSIPNIEQSAKWFCTDNELNAGGSKRCEEEFVTQ